MDERSLYADIGVGTTVLLAGSEGASIDMDWNLKTTMLDKLMNTTQRILLCLGMTLLMVQPSWSEHQRFTQTTLKTLFPSADSFASRPLKLNSKHRVNIESRLGTKLKDRDLNALAYVAFRKGTFVGVAWRTDVVLDRSETTDIIVGVDRRGGVTGVILPHSRAAGSSHSPYLHQFRALTVDSSFQEIRHLQPLTSELASQNITHAVRKAIITIDEAFLNSRK